MVVSFHRSTDEEITYKLSQVMEYETKAIQSLCFHVSCSYVVERRYVPESGLIRYCRLYPEFARNLAMSLSIRRVDTDSDWLILSLISVRGPHLFLDCKSFSE